MVDVLVDFDAAIPTAQATSNVVEIAPGVFEPIPAHEARSAGDPNGTVIDAFLTIGTAYLGSELFFGPGSTPADKTEARSVFLHELGHMFGMLGYRDSTTGISPGPLTPYDTHVTFEADGPVFTGINAGVVQLTNDNYTHFGECGSLLASDLMGGCSFARGRSYEINRLDLAVFADLGIPTVAKSVPAPTTLLLIGIGLGVLGIANHQMRR